MHNPTPLFACGPSIPAIDSVGMMLGIAMAMVVKPLVYLAFVQAFRFRVSGPTAMSFAGAGAAAAARFVFGGVFTFFLSAASLMLMSRGGGSIFVLLATILAGRTASWLFIGRGRVGLNGQRLAGFAIFGTLISIAFDVAILRTIFAGANALFLAPFFVVLGMCLFTIHKTGRRDSLVCRFSDAPHCMACGYNLTGNITGNCPECGTVNITARAAFG